MVAASVKKKALPVLSLNQRQDASATTAWLGAKKPIERAAFQGFCCHRRLRSTAYFVFFFQAEDGIRADLVTGVQTCALPISDRWRQDQPFRAVRPRRRHG